MYLDLHFMYLSRISCSKLQFFSSRAFLFTKYFFIIILTVAPLYFKRIKIIFRFLVRFVMLICVFLINIVSKYLNLF